jgi:hypothetical protein
METTTWLLTGGFAKNYRTYILAGLGAVTAVTQYSLGDADLMHTIQNVTLALSAATIRNAIPEKPPAA